MIVLHATVVESVLRVWGEMPHAVGLSAVGASGDGPGGDGAGGGAAVQEGSGAAVATATGATGARVHPASATHAELVAAVSSLIGGAPEWLAGGSARRITVAVPAADGVPVASPRLAGRMPDAMAEGEAGDGGAVSIGRFEVESVAVPAGEALRALEAVSERVAGGMDEELRVSVGRSVEYFATLARLARHLLAQQRFVPMLMTRREGGLGASWRPWLADEATARRYSLIVAAMPPSARAAVDAVQHDPWQMSESFLAGVVDAECRRVMRDESMGETIEDLDPARDVQVAWISGLLGGSAEVSTTPATKQEMTRRVRTWIAGLEDRGASAAWRLLLHLREPDALDAVEASEKSGVGKGKAAKAGSSDPSELAWKLSLHLQAVGDEAVVLDAEDIWLLAGEGITLSGRRCDQPRDLLLRELGRAARLYKPLEKALDDAEPVALTLSTRQAYEFLREFRALLAEQGFGVRIPEWWDSPLARLGARLRIEADEPSGVGPDGSPAAAPASSSVGLTTLVNYKWEISLGDTTLSLHEFEQLANQKTPLVRVAGKWVEVRPEDVRAAIKFIGENPGGKVRLVEAMRLAYATDAKTTGLPIVGLEARGWVAALLAGDANDEGVPNLDTPGTFNGTLRPYQRRGLSWMSFMERSGLGICLADDMGLGKTIQLLALLMWEREVGGGVVAGATPALDGAVEGATEGAVDVPAMEGGAAAAVSVPVEGGAASGVRPVGPTLLVVPMSVVGNWMHETKRFCPNLRVHVHHGVDRPAGDSFLERVGSADLVITTYALAHRDRETLERVPWHRVVLDEAQYIKNPAAKQTQAVRSITAERRIALTGTPVENRLSELWSIMDFLNPGYLGGPTTFRTRFAVPVERYRDARRAEQLRGLVRPFILRRLKTDPTVVSDLPDKIESREFCHLTTEQATLYEQCVKRMLTEVERSEGIQRRGLVLATLIKLKQICNHPSQMLKDLTEGLSPAIGRSGKCIRLVEMLGEVLAEGDRALVFTQFRQMGSMLVQLLQRELGRDVLFLHGGTPQKQRTSMVEGFQSPSSKHPILVVSLKAGGVGLNLTAATHVFHFDRWWNPAVENQATDRAYRIGQTRTVQVHKFVVRGTLEERIDEMIEKKTELAEKIIGAGERWLTDLSTDDLRDILTLRRDAVGDEGE